MKTDQMNFWGKEFGKEYTDRNPATAKEVNELYQECYGIHRDTMNIEFLNDLSRDIKILEVGCNTGSQLQVLENMGFTNLTGVELQEYAIEKAKVIHKNMNFVVGSGFDLPFKDGEFDLVFTSGVLIHIQPSDLPKIMGQIHRCSNKYVWGMEYFDREIKEIQYRDNNNVMWKGNYSEIYLENFDDLEILKNVNYEYISEADLGCVDQMYLLKKK